MFLLWLHDDQTQNPFSPISSSLPPSCPPTHTQLNLPFLLLPLLHTLNSIFPSSFFPSYTHSTQSSLPPSSPPTHTQLNPPFLLLPLLHTLNSILPSSFFPSYTRKHIHVQFAHSPSASYSGAIHPALISSLSLQHSSRIHYTCKVYTYTQGHV